MVGADLGDYLDGGAGDDVYTVSNTLVRIVEATGGGTDIAVSSISLTLPDQVENILLSGSAGAAEATGNCLNNELRGNCAANALRGLGGDD